MEFILLISFTIMLFISYFMIDNSFLAPSNLYFLGCMISNTALIYGNRVWNDVFDVKTYAVYMTGSVTFLVSSFLYKRTHSYKRKTELTSPEGCKAIAYRNGNINFFVFIQLAALIAYGIFLMKSSRGDTLSALLRAYRSARKEGSIAVPFLLGQCIKLSWALSTIEVYIVVHNFVINKSVKGQKKYLIGLLAFFLLQILQASRIYILLSFLEGLFLYVLMKQAIYGKKKALSLSDFFRIGVLVFAVLYGFILIGTIMGRHSSGTKPPLYYLSMYAGSTMEILNTYIKNGAVEITAFGNGTLYTFAGFDRVLGYVGLLRDKLPQTGAFLYINDSAIGNICANYFYWLYDFGIVGVIVLSSFMSWVYNEAYRRVVKRFQIGKVQFGTLIYVCINYGLIMNGIADYFYRYIFSMNYISMFIFCYLVLKIGFKVKLKM